MVRKAILAAAIAAIGGSAYAQDFKVDISGQVNRGVLFADDGIRSDSFHVDNDNSSTRFRFKGEGEVSPGLKAGLLWEVEYQSAPSNVVNFADNDGGATAFAERHIDLFFQHRFGKLSFGQGDGAGNGVVEIDLSGTDVAHYSDVTAIGGGFAFRTAAGGTGPAFGAVASNQDMESRYDRVRYDTPSFGGFGLALSAGSKDTNDVREAALRYAGDLARLGKIAAGLAWSNEDADPATPGSVDEETIGGAVSWLAPGGLSLTLGHSQKELTATREGKFSYAKVGYQVGKHAVSLDYGLAKDQSAAGDEATSVALAYVYTPIKWAELFAVAKRAQLDQPGVSYEDLSFVMVGTRLKF